MGFEGLLGGHTLAGRYRIGEVIGRGGFAAVYEAVDERLGRTVAVKVITLAASGDEADELRKRFDREARASASLHHPNVVAIYDFGTDPTLGLDFLVMERLRGEDLRARLRRPEPIPLADALRILRDAADGVDAGHRTGLVHRDLKPGNIFLAETNRPGGFRVCVVDFGIARIAEGDETTRITHHGIPLSPAYASPEQLRGEQDLTPASDVFSLGVIGYELLARGRPFPGDRLHPAEGTPPRPVPLRERNPAVPPAVADAIHRAMADDVAERFADAGAFAAALSASERRAGSTSPPARAEVAAPVIAAAGAASAAQPSRSSSVDEMRPVPMREPAGVRVAASASPVAGLRSGGGSRTMIGITVAAVVVLLLAWLGMRSFGRGSSGSPAATMAAKDGTGDSGRTDSTASASAQAGTPARTAAGEASPGVSPGVAPEVAAPITSPDAPVVTSSASPAGIPASSGGAVSPSAGTAGAGAAAGGSAGVPATAGASAPVAPGGRTATADAGAAARLAREGGALFERGDLAGAAARFRQAVATAPANAGYRNDLAWTLFQTGDVEGAARELDEVIRLDPRRAIAYANLGEVRRARGDVAGAIAAYQRFLQLNSDPRREEIARAKLRGLQGGR
ncbi:MAG TPA: protein kinase [Longimicrobiaceae bacterium]|jgi:hypothetical protein|nr:protein kinase [Longimicrobiaceae bacterium]